MSDVSTTSQKIVPNIWSNQRAEEQAEFYAGVFRDFSSEVTGRYPTEGLPDFQKDMAGKPVTVDLQLAGTRITIINAGPEFEPNPSVNFMLNFDPVLYSDASDYLDSVFEKLADGGFVMMPKDEYPFSSKYAWVMDKFGVSWQLILTNPEGEPRPFVMPSLMFCGAAQNKAREAVSSYIDLIPNSSWGMIAEYSEQTGPAEAGSIVFSDFQLAGQWFTAMDSAVEQPFTFGEGMSLMLNAHGQDEIDRYWETLSTVPESEQCGWCKDAFGLSWQVVPDNMDELMSRPGAHEAMMQMGKLEIAKF